MYHVRARHANAADHDDRISTICGLSLKFYKDSNSRDESYWDLTMNTGKYAGFWNFYTFSSMFAPLRVGRGNVPIEQVNPRPYPGVFQGWISSVRYNHSSYTVQKYHSLMVYHYTAANKDKYYAKFRVIPADDNVQEDGLLNTYKLQKKSFSEVPLIKNVPGRESNYAREEFKLRLKDNEEGVRYKLQMQLKPRQLGDSYEIYNTAKLWDEEFIDIGIIHLNQALHDEEIERTRYDPGCVPACLSFPDATSIYDYNSIAYIRTRVYRKLSRLRLFFRDWGYTLKAIFRGFLLVLIALTLWTAYLARSRNISARSAMNENVDHFFTFVKGLRGPFSITY